MPRKERVKGASHERDAANKLKTVYPNAARGIGQSRAGGEAPDVTGTPWWIEAKHRNKVSLRAALRQARAASKECSKKTGQKFAGHLLIVRQTGGEDLAVMALDEFVPLLLELEQLRAAIDAILNEGTGDATKKSGHTAPARTTDDTPANTGVLEANAGRRNSRGRAGNNR